MLRSGVPDDNDPKPGNVDAVASEAQDVVLVHGVTDAGGLEVLRLRNQRLEAGALHRLEHGRPIHGEVVRLRPRPSCPLICDVEVQLADSLQKSAEVSRPPASESSADARRGPAQVASDRYRTGWELIFGGARKPESVN